MRREGEALPRLEDFDPDTLAGAEWVYILLDEGNGVIRITYYGAALAEYFGADMLGKDYAAAVPPEQSAVLREYMTHACEVPCGAFMDHRDRTPNGDEIRYLHLDLPMADNAGKAHALCGLVLPLEQKSASSAEPHGMFSTFMLDFRDFDLKTGASLEAWQREKEQTLEKPASDRAVLSE